MSGEVDFDVVAVGGGLSSGLLALACRHLAPWARLAVVERNHELAGNHTWCFHDRDLGANDEARARVRPWLMTTAPHRVDRQEVHFPDHARQIDRGYSAISADHFARNSPVSAICMRRFRRADGYKTLASYKAVKLDTDA